MDALTLFFISSSSSLTRNGLRNWQDDFSFSKRKKNARWALNDFSTFFGRKGALIFCHFSLHHRSRSDKSFFFFVRYTQSTKKYPHWCAKCILIRSNLMKGKWSDAFFMPVGFQTYYVNDNSRIKFKSVFNFIPPLSPFPSGILFLTTLSEEKKYVSWIPEWISQIIRERGELLTTNILMPFLLNIYFFESEFKIRK